MRSQMRGATAGLDGAGELIQWRAHLARDGVAHVVPALVVFGQDERSRSRRSLRLVRAKAGKAQPLRGGHGPVNVGGAADRNLAGEGSSVDGSMTSSRRA